jgi:class 3 adenylate cyclase
VAANELDADLHVETTTIMFADVVESVRLIEQHEVENVRLIRVLWTTPTEDVLARHRSFLLKLRS